MTLTPQKLTELKQAIAKAKKNYSKTLDFYGNQLDIKYAGYLVEHWEYQFRRMEEQNANENN